MYYNIYVLMGFHKMDMSEPSLVDNDITPNHLLAKQVVWHKDPRPVYVTVPVYRSEYKLMKLYFFKNIESFAEIYSEFIVTIKNLKKAGVHQPTKEDPIVYLLDEAKIRLVDGLEMIGD